MAPGGAIWKLLPNWRASISILTCRISTASRDETIRRLQQLPTRFASVRDSGSSNLHAEIRIKDPPPPGTAEYARGVAVWKSLAEKLAADPAPVHPAALIRCVGTHNTKNGNNGLCRHLWGDGEAVDLTELEELNDLLAEPLLPRKARATNGHDQAEGGPRPAGEHRAPIDVDQRLTAMKFRGPDDSAINLTQLHCITVAVWRSGRRCGGHGP